MPTSELSSFLCVLILYMHYSLRSLVRFHVVNLYGQLRLKFQIIAPTNFFAMLAESMYRRHKTSSKLLVSFYFLRINKFKSFIIDLIFL